ncbi:MAG TPA: hypothetical protein VH302_15890 [Bryobacteraceae bacterium]|nr:hypothetical protein [Bryobacteraceae bacterium]
MPCIEMSTGSGKTLRLIIDLGEPNSYLDLKAVQSLATDMKPMKAEGDADISQVQQTVVPGAKIGDLPMGDFPFTVLDTTPSPDQLNAKEIPPFPADGVLAFRAFQNRIIAIDYAHQKVRISEPLDSEQPCPHDCTQLVVRHVGKYGPVTITSDGFSVSGKPVQAQIDTMFTGTMLIYQDFVKQLGLNKLAKAKHKEFFPYLLGGVRLAQAEGPSLGYNGMVIYDIPLYFFDKEDAHEDPANYDVTVGSGLFSHGTAVFDFKGNHFWLEPAGAH